MGKEKLTKALIDIHSALIAPPHSHADEFLKISILTPFLQEISFRLPHDLAFPLMPLGQFQRAQLDPS